MRRKNTTKQMMKEYISESLLILMESKNYADISIAEITEKAGVNRSTYYRNFFSKEEIVKFYFEQIMNNYLSEYEMSPDKSLETYLHTIFKHFYLYKSQLLILNRNGLSYLLLEVLNRIFEDRQPQKENSSQEEFKLFYHIGGIYNFFVLWFAHGMKEKPTALTRIAVTMFALDAKPVLFK